MGSIFEPLIASGKVNELADRPQIAGLKASLDVPAKEYLRAMRVRRLIQEAVFAMFGKVDLLLAPGRSGPAVKVDQPLDRRAERRLERPRRRCRRASGASSRWETWQGCRRW